MVIVVVIEIGHLRHHCLFPLLLDKKVMQTSKNISTLFFYKQLVYKQPQAQIAKNLSTLLSTLSASDLLSKATFLEKIVANCKKFAKTMQI